LKLSTQSHLYSNYNELKPHYKEHLGLRKFHEMAGLEILFLLNNMGLILSVESVLSHLLIHLSRLDRCCLVPGSLGPNGIAGRYL